MARPRIALLIVAMAASTVAGVATSCSSFESGDDPGPGDASPEAETPDTSPPPVDAMGVDADADAMGVDAGPRIIRCGSEKCIVGEEECCIFDLGAGDFEMFCAEGQCPATRYNDAGAKYTRRAFACDDPTDCPIAGNVCCLRRGALNCSQSGFTSGECMAPANCPDCALEAGVGVMGCRGTITSDCPDGSACTGQNTSYPFFQDFTFCKAQ